MPTDVFAFGHCTQSGNLRTLRVVDVGIRMAPHVGSMAPGPFIIRREASVEADGMQGGCLLTARANLKVGFGDLISFRVVGTSCCGRLSSPSSLK